ncbi:MAG: EthD domain-containing protein [Acidobacteria bacterium]|nr:EthD domain-containing protein [Acidobacteriota bacterium]
MIRLFYPMRRLPHLSLEEFQDHWYDVHAELNRPFRLIRRYIQYHTLANDPTRDVLEKAQLSALEPYDGVPSAYYDNLDDMRLEHDVERTWYTGPAVQDHYYFIDDNRSIACVAHEHVVIEPEGTVPYVLFGCLRRRAEFDPATFQQTWLDHTRFLCQAYELGLLKGYIQNHTLLGEDGGLEGLGSTEEPWDGLETVYFESVAKFKAFAASDVAQNWFEDEKSFIDHSQSVYMLTRRRVIKQIVR